MTSTVTKAGPYYASGSISFSSLRATFRAQQPDGTFLSDSLPIKASELRRNTTKSNDVANPTVPDAKENASISTLNNLKLSQFRNSIKYYFITQTDTDLNYDIDAQTWNTNLNKNIRKWMYLNGTCGSNNPASYAAIHDAEAWNLTIQVAGTILGAAGVNGTKASTNGGNGGGALFAQSSGGKITVNILSDAKVYGGGGGGAGGQDGTTGSSGACYSRVTYNAAGRCGSCDGCGGGYCITCANGTTYCSYGANSIGGCNEHRGCACWFGWYRGWNCRRKKYHDRNCERYDPTCVSGAPGGTGSNGISGRGYNNQINDLTGATATAGTVGGCPSYGGSGTDGIAGGDGGDWGKSGASTSRGETAIGTGGSAGRAVGPALGNYAFDANAKINSSTVLGAFNP